MQSSGSSDTRLIEKNRSLIEASKRGNRKAQYDLYELYVDAMFNVTLRMVGNREDAEDILQESFVSAFQKLESFGYQSPFGSWLKKIVVNKSLDFLRKKKLNITPLENHDFRLSEADEEHEYDKLDMDKIRRGIQLLPNGYRQVFCLYLIEGYDHDEISEITGVSVSTSKTQYHRAKRKLIQIVKTL